MQELNPGDLPGRVRALECEGRRLRKFGILATIFLAAITAWGLVPEEAIPDVQRARAFEVVDSEGNVVARLGLVAGDAATKGGEAGAKRVRTGVLQIADLDDLVFTTVSSHGVRVDDRLSSGKSPEKRTLVPGFFIQRKEGSISIQGNEGGLQLVVFGEDGACTLRMPK